MIKVSLLDPASEFTLRSDLEPKQSSVTLTINRVSENGSQLQYRFAFTDGALVLDGSDMIQVLFGSMKEDLSVILKCQCFC